MLQDCGRPGTETGRMLIDFYELREKYGYDYGEETILHERALGIYEDMQQCAGFRMFVLNVLATVVKTN
jgi:hypothetical protein